MPQANDPVICTFADGHEEPGTVVFQRNAPPTYTVAEAYSVRLDSRASRPGYEGTMFAADKVRLAEGAAAELASVEARASQEKR